MGRRGKGEGWAGGMGKICGKLYNTEICNNSMKNNFRHTYHKVAVFLLVSLHLESTPTIN